MKEDLQEIQNLHYLLDGYKSILVRYNEESNLEFGNWKYSSQSSLGRPDRQRSKYTKDEAIDQLHNVDAIFPLYENYFNVTDVKANESLREVLNERVSNIDKTLKLLEMKYEIVENSSLGMNSDLLKIFVVLITGLLLKIQVL